MSIQYTVLGLKLTTFGTRVSSITTLSGLPPNYGFVNFDKIEDAFRAPPN